MFYTFLIIHNRLFTGALVLLLVLYGVATTAMAYFVSCLASSAISGFSWLMIVFVVTAIIGGNAVYVLNAFRFIPETAEYFSTVSEILRISPAFSGVWGISKLYSGSALANVCTRIPESILNVSCNAIKVDKVMRGCCPGKPFPFLDSCPYNVFYF